MYSPTGRLRPAPVAPRFGKGLMKLIERKLDDRSCEQTPQHRAQRSGIHHACDTNLPSGQRQLDRARQNVTPYPGQFSRAPKYVDRILTQIGHHTTGIDVDFVILGKDEVVLTAKRRKIGFSLSFGLRPSLAR